MQEDRMCCETTFLRMHCNTLNKRTGQPEGLFAAVWRLVDRKAVTDSEAQEYWNTRNWFEENLPNPPYYKEGNPERALTWYKNTKPGLEMKAKMEPFTRIATKYGLTVITEETGNPGRIIYEDEYQVGAVPENPNG